MHWLNLHYSVLDSEAVVGSEPVDRATWLFLLHYCCSQENGGVIAGAKTWGDRRWQQVCRVTLAEIKRECSLWAWYGDDLHVYAYPVDKEAEVKAKRTGGKAGANARWNGSPISSPNGSAINISDAEGKGREGKGSGREAEPPPLSNSKGSKIETKALLDHFGLPGAPSDVREWAGGLSRVARCRSKAEAIAFMEWAIGVCDSQSVVVEHWRHVRRLAFEWREGRRDQHFNGVAS